MMVDVVFFAWFFSRCMPIAFHILGTMGQCLQVLIDMQILYIDSIIFGPPQNLVVRREPLQNWFASVLSKTLFNVSHVITQLNCKGRGSIFGPISYILIYFPPMSYMFTYSFILLYIYIHH